MYVENEELYVISGMLGGSIVPKLSKALPKETVKELAKLIENYGDRQYNIGRAHGYAQGYDDGIEAG
ncbi:hypothetical protein [Bacillus wiedmannii]|uniref:hypothetical protein n=1 Tax=Bacillus wiedmannii TaxID=1890302 RepID=UPI000BF0132F|nr:hypothetical protein [Bacillus wiedmannii]PEM08543.1 hypothetical protein CN610_20030 [Bacillus wiedmannii]